jgi:hypothetical protein
LIKERSVCGQVGATYEIYDPQSQNRVGIVREEGGAVGKYLPVFLKKLIHSTKLEARETLDESLVFTVYRTIALWRRGIEVYDAEDHLIGYSDNWIFSERGIFWIYDRRGVPFVEVKASLRGRRCSFVDPEGRELGVLSNEETGTGIGAGANPHLVSISEELLEQPLAKMLLLGAALAMAIGHHGPAR